MWPSKTGVTRGLESDPEHELYDPEQLKVPHGLWLSKTGVTRGMESDPEHELYDPEQLKVPHGLCGSARPVSPVVWRVTRNS